MPEEPSAITPSNALVDVLSILAPRSGFRSITSFLEHVTRAGEEDLTAEYAETMAGIRGKLGFPESPQR